MDAIAQLSTPIFIATFAFVLGGIIYIFFNWDKVKSAEAEPSRGGGYIFAFFGFVPLIIGIVVAARTIHLYVNGIETSATIEKTYTRSSTTRPKHGRPRSTKTRSTKTRRYALVRYETEKGMTESEVQIKRSTRFRTGETVQVIYLPTAPPNFRFWPRVAIRGHAIQENILLAPLVLISVGSLFFGFGLAAWAKQINNTTIQKRLSSTGWTFILTAILAIFIIIPTWALYKFVPWTYHKFYKSMRPAEETLYEPLLGPGVMATKLAHAELLDACKKPQISIRSLSHTMATSGDVVELNGKWGQFTSNKVPRISDGYYPRRLKVLKWTTNVIRVEIPKWLKPGRYKISVICYTVSSHKSSIPSSSLEIQIN